MIKLMECERCGATSFRKVKGVWTCNYCGASYIIKDGRDDKISHYTKKAEVAFENGNFIDIQKVSSENSSYNKFKDYIAKNNKTLKISKIKH